MRSALIAFFTCAVGVAQTFSNVNTSADLDVHSVRITAQVSQDGWVQVNYGTTSGGPYLYSSPTYCTTHRRSFSQAEAVPERSATLSTPAGL